MKRIHLVTFVLFFSSALCNWSMAFQKPELITIKGTLSKTLNLSEIAESIEMIALESTEETDYDGMRDLIFTEEYIFVSVILKIQGVDKSKILQYDRKGNFIRRVGIDFNGWISLIHDPFKEMVGASEGGEATFYDYAGVKIERINTVAKKPFYFSNHIWGVTIGYPDSQRVKYTLKRTDLDGSNSREIFEFYDQTQGIVGQFIRFSVVGEHLYFWNSFENTLCEIVAGEVQPSFEFKMKRGVKPWVNGGVKGKWMVMPAFDQRRRISILNLVNLTSGVTYSVPNRGDSGILDDISGAGFLKYYDTGAIYGAVQNKIVFRKEKRDLPQFADSFDSDNSHVLFIATLK